MLKNFPRISNLVLFFLFVKKEKKTLLLCFCSVQDLKKFFIYLVVGNAMMPDAMETIFEAALDLGKLGGVSSLLPFMLDKQFKSEVYNIRLLYDPSHI